MNNNTNDEIWVDVNGFEKYYQVSNKGSVRSKDRVTYGRNKSVRTVKGRVLTQEITRGGYCRVSLSVNGKIYRKSVHRLVATSFISPQPLKEKQVNHIDSCKKNNRVENLEWVTPSQNKKHSYQSNTSDKKGENHHHTKLTNVEVLKIRRLYDIGEYTQKELGVMFGQSRRNIGKIVNKTNWKHI